MATIELVAKLWDEEILPTLTDFIAIPNVSPAYEPGWVANGHMADAVELVRSWCAARPIEGISVEVHELDRRTPVILVDNGSTDGSAEAVESAFPAVTVVRAGRNLGATGRTLGVRAATTPYVAFCDDDSWWAPGALDRAAEYFAALPQLGLIAGRILIGAAERPDPVCAEMAASPLGRPNGLPGPAVLGFIACGAVVRRSAYLAGRGDAAGPGPGRRQVGFVLHRRRGRPPPPTARR